MNTNAVPAPPVHTHGTHQSGRLYLEAARENTPAQLFPVPPGTFKATSLFDSVGVAGCFRAVSAYSNLPAGRVSPPRTTWRGVLRGVPSLSGVSR